VSFANLLILENALMALDNAARCGQMLTVGSEMFRQVGGRRVTAESIGSKNR
jgi:hypothetical protein